MMTPQTRLTRWTERQLQRLPSAYALEGARHVARVLDVIAQQQYAGLPPPADLCSLLAVPGEAPPPLWHDQAA